MSGRNRNLPDIKSGDEISVISWPEYFAHLYIRQKLLKEGMMMLVLVLIMWSAAAAVPFRQAATSGVATTATTRASAAKCRDKVSTCSGFKKQGLCTDSRFKAYLSQKCCKSCSSLEVGSWGSWGPFTLCSRTCGRGVQIRTRSCKNNSSTNGDGSCQGSSKDGRFCNNKRCPVSCPLKGINFRCCTLKKIRNVKSWKSCSRKCLHNPKCYAWSWLKSYRRVQMNHCYLKSKKFNRAKERFEGYISGEKSCIAEWHEMVSMPSSIRYVDQSNGTLNTTCGLKRSTACKHLSTAVKQSRVIIHIIGDVALNETIHLYRHVYLKTNEKDQGRIIGIGKVDYAFVVKRMFVIVNITGISFINIGVLFSTMTTNVYVSNVHVIGGNWTLFDARQQGILRVEMTFSIFSSSFVRTQRVVYSWSGLPEDKKTKFSVSMQISDSTFRDTKGIVMYNSYGNVNINRCTFQHQRGDWAVTAGLIQTVTITSSIFANNSFTSGIVWTYFVAKVFITKSTFTNDEEMKNGCVFVQHVSESLIEQSTFTKCHSKDSGGALFIYNPSVSVIVQHCSFERNWAMKTGGAIYILHVSDYSKKTDGKISIEHCNFVKNEALRVGQSVHSTGIGNVNLKDITIRPSGTYGVTHLQIGGDAITLGEVNVLHGDLKSVQSSTVTRGIVIISGNLRVTGNVTYACSKHFNVISFKMSYEKTKPKRIYTSFEAHCVTCEAEKYTLKAGSLTVYPMREKSSEWFQNSSPSVCLPCPPGAQCNGNIIPLENHWGYRVSSTKIIFKQCPTGYCCSSQGTPCKDYNTCSKGRTGILCGSCDIGYAQSFVSDGCVWKDDFECNIKVFIFYFVLASYVYTTIFSFTPSITKIIKDKYASWKGNNPALTMQETSGQEEEELQGDDVSIHGRCARESPPLSAYVTNVMYYIQLASLVHINIPNLSGDKGSSDFQNTLFNIFNFRLTVYRKLCPTDDLTLPMKELINVSLKLCSIFNLVTILVIWKCVTLIKKKVFCNNHAGVNIDSPEVILKLESSVSPEVRDTSQEFAIAATSLSSTSTLKVGFIKLMKLNLTSIFTFTFQMVHCVRFDGSDHLYLYGDQECYTYWQFIILFGVLPIVLLFPAAFGISLNLLKKGHISTNTFLQATAFPYYAFWLYGKEKLIGLDRNTQANAEQLCVSTILEMEEELFKTDESLLRWPVCQLYRNFTVVILNTFILNPIYRITSLVPVFLVFALHDRHRLPYKHNYLNLLQCLSSSCLCVMAVCNFPASLVVMTNALAVPHMKSVVVAAQYIEMSLYAIVPFSLVAWKVLEKYKLQRAAKKDM